MKALIFALCLFFSQIITANHYVCTIKTGYSLDKKGELANSKYIDLSIGKQFEVNITSGVMKGELSNSFSSGEPRIIDSGTSASAFKVMTISNPHINVRYLYIQTFAKEARKPYLFIEGNNIYSGDCNIRK